LDQQQQKEVVNEARFGVTTSCTPHPGGEETSLFSPRPLRGMLALHKTFTTSTTRQGQMSFPPLLCWPTPLSHYATTDDLDGRKLIKAGRPPSSL